MRRRYYYNDDSPLVELISVGLVIFLIYFIAQYFIDRTYFWQLFFYALAVIFISTGAILWWKRLKQKRLNEIFDQIDKIGLHEYIENFINRFGFEGKKGKDYEYRGHIFDWQRIDDLEKILLEKGLKLRLKEKQRDVFSILRHYIQEKEEELTRQSINHKLNKFTNLAGTDFENLLYRLFESMGYSVQKIGKSGDQGGDLIANKNSDRILIQAKCYRDWSTGNAAVQQVVAATKHYDCNQAMVITTSYFTPEAITLAKDNNVELIPKNRLQELLLEYLKESWD